MQHDSPVALKDTYSPVLRRVHEIPMDTLTPVSALMRLNPEEACFLFESGGADLNQARYSFLGLNPEESLILKQGCLERHWQGQIETLPGPPLQTLKAILEQQQVAAAPDLAPFCGGYVGYLGYDIVRYLEAIPLPPGQMPEACLMRFQNLLIFDHLKRRIQILVNIFPERGDVELQESQAKAFITHTLIKLRQPAAAEQLLELPDLATAKIPRGLAGPERFCEGVKSLKAHILEGDIFQAVLSERFEVPLEADPFLIYRVLRSLNPSPYLFYLNTGQQVLLGGSPEMLVKSDGQQISNCPIAGTRPRGKNKSEDLALGEELLADEKECAEHLMLVDLGRNDIGRVARPGSVKVSRYMEVEHFSHVMHLVSQVDGKLATDKTPFDALLACFPAGTLSGAPKVRAMQLLAELEPQARDWYGGSVFYHGFDGQLDACITIRSICIQDQKVTLQAGAGIVADSDPEKEYQEVCNKAQALFQAIALANAVTLENKQSGDLK